MRDWPCAGLRRSNNGREYLAAFSIVFVIVICIETTAERRRRRRSEQWYRSAEHAAHMLPRSLGGLVGSGFTFLLSSLLFSPPPLRTKVGSLLFIAHSSGFMAASSPALCKTIAVPQPDLLVSSPVIFRGICTSCNSKDLQQFVTRHINPARLWFRPERGTCTGPLQSLPGA